MKLFVFGSTGDLVKRKVLRALQEIDKDNLEIYALGRKNMDKQEYKEFICSDWCRPDFKERLHYLSINFDKLDLKDFVDYFDKEGNNYFYLSLPPGLVGKVLVFLSKIKDAGYKLKVLSEKPFGESLRLAENLKEMVLDLNLFEDFSISDHYLFKNSFKQLPDDFSQVRIVSIEEVGLESRINYYDSVGALRDMVQSHFLNLVMKNMGFEFDLDDLNVREFVKKQYDGYVSDLGKNSNTETYVRLVFSNKGKGFEFITGKAFDKKLSYVEVDGEKFVAGEDNSYVEIFEKFFAGEIENFPTIDESILAWRIVEEIERIEGKGELQIYSMGVSL